MVLYYDSQCMWPFIHSCCALKYLNYVHMHAGPAPALSRLGIKPYQWGTECLSGDVIAGPATSFPQSIGMVQTVFI